jgi:hypothetical protein
VLYFTNRPKKLLLVIFEALEQEAITEKLIKNKIDCTERVFVKAGPFSLEREERLLV